MFCGIGGQTPLAHARMVGGKRELLIKLSTDYRFHLLNTGGQGQCYQACVQLVPLSGGVLPRIIHESRGNKCPRSGRVKIAQHLSAG